MLPLEAQPLYPDLTAARAAIAGRIQQLDDMIAWGNAQKDFLEQQLRQLDAASPHHYRVTSSPMSAGAASSQSFDLHDTSADGDTFGSGLDTSQSDELAHEFAFRAVV